jgi:putative spermidine/putrescine transport system substrate-binding protein
MWEGTLRATRAIAAASVAIASILLAAGCSGGSSSSSTAAGGSGTGGSGAAANASTATSAADLGGMDALVAAAKKEGQLNAIALPRDWANYGVLMDNFTKKYGIKITDANPDGSSQDEVNAIKQLKGQGRAPDVVDVGGAFADSGDASGLWAPYKVATWDSIPAAAKVDSGDYYADYGGYIAIGYDPAKVKTPPASFKDLLSPVYKNQVAINGDPTSAGAALAAVYAAALSNGGSLDNIAPGIAYFKQLKQSGNFVPATGSAATMQSGQTPVLIWWDYLLASGVKAKMPSLKIVIPSDAAYAGYYYQAISKTAPHPAAARLWEEYLYSAEGQNGFLDGFARPIELQALITAGTVDKTANAALPPAPAGELQLPTIAQQNTAKTLVTQQWPTVKG